MTDVFIAQSICSLLTHIALPMDLESIRKIITGAANAIRRMQPPLVTHVNTSAT